MYALSLIPAVILSALEFLGISHPTISTSPNPSSMSSDNAHTIVTDLTVNFCDPTVPHSTCALDPRRWRRIEKELHLHTSQQSAWLQIEQKSKEDLTAHELVVTDVSLGRQRPPNADWDHGWEVRPGGIWVRRSNYTGDSNHVVTGADVLFGVDAVDPRPQWTLLPDALILNVPPEVPAARLSVRHGNAKSRPDSSRPTLRARGDGKFKIVQISDTHMVTGVGVCKDAIDAHGRPLPESVADPLTVEFLESILDVEKPNLVILTGDQCHHGILDTKSTLLKLVAPLIKRSIPYAAVFGNHDDEGPWALSRK